MKTAKFWMSQLMMLAMLSLALGSPVSANPPDHANSGKTVTSAVTADEGEMTQGEETRLENANLDEGKASWKNGEPSCSSENPELCTTQELCDAAGGIWFNECIFPTP